MGGPCALTRIRKGYSPMLKAELLNDLDEIRRVMPVSREQAAALLDRLVLDIQDNGVLDVQAPPEIAEDLDLPRPAASFHGRVSAT